MDKLLISDPWQGNGDPDRSPEMLWLHLNQPENSAKLWDGDGKGQGENRDNAQVVCCSIQTMQKVQVAGETQPAKTPLIASNAQEFKSGSHASKDCKVPCR